MGPAAKQSSVVGFIDAAGTDPSTDAVPSLLMRKILKKDDRCAAPVVARHWVARPGLSVRD